MIGGKGRAAMQYSATVTHNPLIDDERSRTLPVSIRYDVATDPIEATYESGDVVTYLSVAALMRAHEVARYHFTHRGGAPAAMGWLIVLRFEPSSDDALDEVLRDHYGEECVSS